MKVRKEVHTRTIYAYEQGERYFKIMKHNQVTGNIFSGVATTKFLQARRIYIYYTQEFQRNLGLALTK